MESPTPWRTQSEERASELLSQARGVREWPAGKGEQLLARAARTARRRRRQRWVVRGSLGLVLAVAGVLLAIRTPLGKSGRTVTLAGIGTLELTDFSALQIPPDLEAADERAVYLRAGRASAQIDRQPPGKSFAVVTPHLRVVVVGTRFVVTVAPEATEVEVLEGLVRLESPDGRTVPLAHGERLRWEAALPGAPPQQTLPTPTPSPTPTPTPTPASVSSPSGDRPPGLRVESAGGDDLDCVREKGTARRECLERLAAGEGLTAQNALYSLGLLARDEAHDGARALRAWREYARRFPDGALAPEVSLGMVEELMAQRRYAEALREAEAFGARFETDLRSPELALVRARIWCVRFGQADRALQEYARALGPDAQPAVRDEALYSRGRCLELLQGPAAALEDWRRYLAEFPDGAHAREVRARAGAETSAVGGPK